MGLMSLMQPSWWSPATQPSAPSISAENILAAPVEGVAQVTLRLWGQSQEGSENDHGSDAAPTVVIIEDPATSAGMPLPLPHEQPDSELPHFPIPFPVSLGDAIALMLYRQHLEAAVQEFLTQSGQPRESDSEL